MDVLPPQQLIRPINVPHKTMVGPGPSNLSPRIEKAAGLQPMSVSFLHPEMHQIFDEAREGIKYLFQTKNKATFCVSGCAHMAAESVCFNLVEPNDVLLLACNGLWAQRFSEIAERQGVQHVRKLEKPQGQAFDLSEIEQGLKTVKPALFFITHGESTGGVLQPLEGIGKLCHKYGCLLVVDSVAAAGAVPLFMDRWEIDVIYTCSQKVLGTPSGIAPISVSSRAWNKVESRKSKVATFVFDWKLLFDVWGCDEHSMKRYNYHHTYSFSNIYCVRESLSVLTEEGLENWWKRHQECTKQLHRGVQALGLELLVKNPELRLPVVTTIRVPAGIDWKVVSQYAMDKYKLEIAGGLGANASDIWRIGLMGFNAYPDTVALALKALGEGLEKARAEKISTL